MEVQYANKCDSDTLKDFFGKIKDNTSVEVIGQHDGIFYKIVTIVDTMDGVKIIIEPNFY